VNDLTERLNRLERKNRRLTRAVALLTLAFVALATVGWTSPDGSVEAQKFVLRDVNGKARAVLSMVAGAPTFDLRGADGRVRAELVVLADGARLTLSDANGEPRVNRTREIRPSGIAGGPAET